MVGYILIGVEIVALCLFFWGLTEVGWQVLENRRNRMRRRVRLRPPYHPIR